VSQIKTIVFEARRCIEFERKGPLAKLLAWVGSGNSMHEAKERVWEPYPDTKTKVFNYCNLM